MKKNIKFMFCNYNFYKSDFVLNTVGRPFGGSCWFINKKVKIIQTEFLNEHVSYVKIEYQGCKYLIIGVYMTYDNNKMDSLIEYEMNLSILSELVKNVGVTNEYRTIMGGDFNADCYRQKRFDNKFTEFASKNKLIILSELMMQKTNYSYRNGDYSAQLDHILYSEKIKGKIKNNNNLNKSKLSENMVLQINVLEDLINVSDHHAVQLRSWMKEENST